MILRILLAALVALVSFPAMAETQCAISDLFTCLGSALQVQWDPRNFYYSVLEEWPKLAGLLPSQFEQARSLISLAAMAAIYLVATSIKLVSSESSFFSHFITPLSVALFAVFGYDLWDFQYYKFQTYEVERSCSVNSDKFHYYVLLARYVSVENTGNDLLKMKPLLVNRVFPVHLQTDAKNETTAIKFYFPIHTLYQTQVKFFAEFSSVEIAMDDPSNKIELGNAINCFAGEILFRNDQSLLDRKPLIENCPPRNNLKCPPQNASNGECPPCIRVDHFADGKRSRVFFSIKEFSKDANWPFNNIIYPQ